MSEPSIDGLRRHASSLVMDNRHITEAISAYDKKCDQLMLVQGQLDQLKGTTLAYVTREHELLKINDDLRSQVAALTAACSEMRYMLNAASRRTDVDWPDNYEFGKGWKSPDDFAALTKERDRYEKALGEWEEREAKVCPENVSFESVIAALAKERDGAVNSAKYWVEQHAIETTKRGEAEHQLDMARGSLAESFENLERRLHALEQGVKVAVEELDKAREPNPSSSPFNIANKLMDGVVNALAHLTPLLTTSTKERK